MGVLDAENANKSSSSSNKSSSSKSSSGSTKSSGSTSNHAAEREIDRSTANRSSSSPSSERSERPSSSSVGSDRREIDRSLSERSTSSDRSTGLNTSGNRASGAGPMSTSNRNTTPTGLSPTLGGHATERGIDRSLGSRTTPATPTGGLYTSARATEIKSMQDYDQYRATDLASKARASENASMATLQAARDALLDTIAGTESPGYDVQYGGAKFTSFDDHPRQGVPITSGPNAGKLSTAAGRYQFLGSTWDIQKAKLGLKDFSPKSQDAAAYDLAKEAYKAKTGKSLDAVLASGDAKAIADVGKALSGTWTSLPGGIEQATTGSKFASSYERNLANRTGSGGGSLPSTVSELPTARPSVERFAENYLGGSRPNTGGLSPKQIDAYKDAGLNRSYSPLNPVTRVAASSAPAQQAAVRPANRDASGGVTVIGDNKPATQPEQKSGSPIVAGGIDVLLGSIPGIGMGATVMNAGLSLTGNRTIGQRIADDFANGGGKNGSVLMAREGSDRPEKASSGARGKKSADPVVRFEETYLAPSTPFDDGVKRPTPGERWGGIGLG